MLRGDSISKTIFSWINIRIHFFNLGLSFVVVIVVILKFPIVYQYLI